MTVLIFIILLLLSAGYAWPAAGPWALGNYVGLVCFLLSLYGLIKSSGAL